MPPSTSSVCRRMPRNLRVRRRLAIRGRTPRIPSRVIGGQGEQPSGFIGRGLSVSARPPYSSTPMHVLDAEVGSAVSRAIRRVGFPFALAVLAGVTTISYERMERSRNDLEWRAHTYQVLEHIERPQTALLAGRPRALPGEGWRSKPRRDRRGARGGCRSRRRRPFQSERSARRSLAQPVVEWVVAGEGAARAVLAGPWRRR